MSVIGILCICFARTPGTGTLISRKGKLWLLTANSVLKDTRLSVDSLKNIDFHFGYVNQSSPGIAISATDLLIAESCYSHDKVSTQSPLSHRPLNLDLFQVESGLTLSLLG